MSKNMMTFSRVILFTGAILPVLAGIVAGVMASAGNYTPSLLLIVQGLFGAMPFAGLAWLVRSDIVEAQVRAQSLVPALLRGVVAWLGMLAVTTAAAVASELSTVRYSSGASTNAVAAIFVPVITFALGISLYGLTWLITFLTMSARRRWSQPAA